MKHLLIAILFVFGIVACDDIKTTSNQSPPVVVKTKADFAKYVDNGVEYDVNDQGVLIFVKVRDMFANFGDYIEEQGELKILSESPLSIRISKIKYTPDDMYKEYNEMAFLYAIYKTFIHTNINEITVEAYPIYENLDTKKQKALKNLTIKSTVTRQRALEVLKKYTNAGAFNDLVQLTENNQYRQIGVSGSELWDKFIYNDKMRPDIITELLK